MPNVAEVATIGGFNRQYQIVVDPGRLRAFAVAVGDRSSTPCARRTPKPAAPLSNWRKPNTWCAREAISLRSTTSAPSASAVGADGTAIRLGDVATVQLGPEIRRGVADLDGEGEVVGGVIVLRSGANALAAIAAVKTKLQALQAGLPDGVEIVPTYDRSSLIDRAIANLSEKLIEEFVVVILVCALFLWHLRSALVAIMTLPVGVLAAFVVMQAQGINANIMSLGGIAIAIGAMVDAGVVMIENAHKKLEAWRHAHDGVDPARGATRRTDHAGGGRGRSGAVLQPADRDAVVRAGVHAAGAGRSAVRAARVHENVCDGGGGRTSA